MPAVLNQSFIMLNSISTEIIEGIDLPIGIITKEQQVLLTENNEGFMISTYPKVGSLIIENWETIKAFNRNVTLRLFIIHERDFRNIKNTINYEL